MSEVIVQVCPVLDELVTDEGAVVLLGTAGGHRVVRLSVLGQLIRELAAQAISVRSLVEKLQAILGPASGGDPSSIVQTAIADLERDGLVLTRQDEPLSRNVTNRES